MRGFGGLRGCLGFGKGGLRGLDRACERSDIGLSAAGRGEAGLDIGEFGFEPLGALRLIVDRAFELMAARGEVGEFAGEFAESPFRRREHGVRLRDPLIGAAAARGAFLHLGSKRLLLGGKPAQRRLGVGDEPALAFEVGGELHQTAIEFADALLGAAPPRGRASRAR